MAVRVKGRRYGRVAEAFLHNFRMGSFSQKQTRVEVPEIVQSNFLNLSYSREFSPGMRKRRRIERFAVRAGKD